MQNEWSHCYRLRPYFRNVGIAGTAFFGGMACLMFVAVFIQPPNQVNMAGVMSLLLAFTLLGVWLLLHYRYYRLFANESALLQIGVIRRKQICFDKVTELKWRCYPQGGSVRLSGSTGGLAVELGNFCSQDREHVISLLRNTVDEYKQVGWNEFSIRFRDSPAKRARLRRICGLLMAILVANSIGFLVCWIVGLGFQYLIFSVVNALASLFMGFQHRKHSANNGEQIRN